MAFEVLDYPAPEVCRASRCLFQDTRRPGDAAPDQPGGAGYSQRFHMVPMVVLNTRARLYCSSKAIGKSAK